MRDGQRRDRRVASRSRSHGVVWVRVASAGSGYRITPLRRPAWATVRTIATSPQPSAPDPGPTVEVGLGRGQAFAARLTVRR